MDVDSTTFLLGMINAMVKGLMLTGPIVQTLMDEVIAFGEPLKEVLIIDIVHWDVKMMIAACGWRIVLELPVDSGDDVRDIAVFQSLCTFETDEPDAVSYEIVMSIARRKEWRRADGWQRSTRKGR